MIWFTVYFLIGCAFVGATLSTEELNHCKPPELFIATMIWPIMLAGGIGAFLRKQYFKISEKVQDENS